MLLILDNLNLNLDFDYRIIREENDDVDIFIDINYPNFEVDYTDSIINIKNQNEKVILNKSIKK
ncbi:hypothetical protein [Clostridioides difficile]|uniref:hypothetical protein n=1 Tax=Clostridioides difficile TaxID=1496 RepID=UPI0028A3283B|nr:hypothetical protein [Clostridioides difficile]KAK2207826.1 hypothetical protein CDPitt_04400 [Clostridioides difficile]